MSKAIEASVEFYKPSGKWYGHSGLFQLKARNFYDAIKEIKEKHRLGKIPGVTGGGQGFHLYVTIDSMTHLILEKELKDE